MTVPADQVPVDRLTRFAGFVGRIIPDAMSTSIAMLAALGLIALAMGNSLGTVGEAYYRGLWLLLPFTMQMTLILVLSSTLGASPVFKRVVARLSRIPTTELGTFAMAIGLAASLSYLYWGLGLALGPLVAVYFAREAERRGMPLDFPFFLATTMAATSVWQFGLSASAPLLMNTPGHFLEGTTGRMPLGTTIWAPASIAFIAVFLVAILIAARFLKPARPQPLSVFPDAYHLADPIAEAEPIGPTPVLEPPSARLERSSIPILVLAVMLVGWLFYHFAVKDLGLDLNSLNTTLLLATVLVHRNVRNFSKALQSGILSCWPIVVLYHLYAGVAGLIQFTTLGEQFAGAFAAISTRYTFPFLTALASTVVALFVPSSGGQWAIQGFVTARAAEAVGVSVQRGLLALSVGDQMGNLMTPFWAVISGGMARIDFRRFIGYSIAFAAIWFVLGVLAFTFLPA
ncbi:MAG: TIGR00366 family protein [Gemmatimonadales bacterium]